MNGDFENHESRITNEFWLSGVRQRGAQLSATSHHVVDRPELSAGTPLRILFPQIVFYLPERLNAVPYLPERLDAVPWGSKLRGGSALHLSKNSACHRRRAATDN